MSYRLIRFIDFFLAKQCCFPFSLLDACATPTPSLRSLTHFFVTVLQVVVCSSCLRPWSSSSCWSLHLLYSVVHLLVPTFIISSITSLEKELAVGYSTMWYIHTRRRMDSRNDSSVEIDLQWKFKTKNTSRIKRKSLIVLCCTTITFLCTFYTNTRLANKRILRFLTEQGVALFKFSKKRSKLYTRQLLLLAFIWNTGVLQYVQMEMLSIAPELWKRHTECTRNKSKATYNPTTAQIRSRYAIQREIFHVQPWCQLKEVGIRDVAFSSQEQHGFV